VQLWRVGPAAAALAAAAGAGSPARPAGRCTTGCRCWRPACRGDATGPRSPAGSCSTRAPAGPGRWRAASGAQTAMRGAPTRSAELAAGWIARGTDAGELAGVAGIDTTNLAATLRDYAATVRQRRDDDLPGRHRRSWRRSTRSRSTPVWRPPPAAPAVTTRPASSIAMARRSPACTRPARPVRSGAPDRAWRGPLRMRSCSAGSPEPAPPTARGDRQPHVDRGSHYARPDARVRGPPGWAPTAPAGGHVSGLARYPKRTRLTSSACEPASRMSSAR